MNKRSYQMSRTTWGKGLATAALSGIGLIGMALPSYGDGIIHDRSSFEGISEIVVHSSSVAIEVEKGNASLGVEAVDFPSGYELLSARQGSVLELRMKFPVLPSFDSIGLRPRIVIELPPSVHSLKLESSSGRINVTDADLAALAISSSSGAIRLDHARATVLQAESSSGAMAIDRFDGTMSAKTSSGGIELREARGSFLLGTSSGSIRLEEISGMLGATTKAGSIKGSAIVLTANSSFETSSGSISLGLAMPPSSLSFDLSSISGSLKAADSRSRKSLVAGSGPILIRGKTSSGSQDYRIE
jgi:hypothetical protein